MHTLLAQTSTQFAALIARAATPPRPIARAILILSVISALAGIYIGHAEFALMALLGLLCVVVARWLRHTRHMPHKPALLPAPPLAFMPVAPHIDLLTPAPQPQRPALLFIGNETLASTAALLARTGYDSRAVHTVFDVQTMLGNFRPDIIFIDVEMLGYTLVRQLRTYLEPQPRLIALTHYHTEEHRDRIHTYGFDGHLTLPLTLRALERVLRDATIAL